MSKTGLPLVQDVRRSTSGIGAIWDESADKYKCCCRSLHVSRAAIFIAYTHILVTILSAGIFSLYFAQYASDQFRGEHWIFKVGQKSLVSMLMAVALQFVIVLLLLHGIRSERKSFLIPYMILASVAIFIDFMQLGFDFVGFMHGSSDLLVTEQNNQFFSHFMEFLLHMWCVAIIWRCYGYLGDKKMARQIGDQLSATHYAFHYGDIPFGYVSMPQPPPYANTVISGDKQSATVS